MLSLGSHLQLGIAALDDQHQELVDLINAVGAKIEGASQQGADASPADHRACCQHMRELLGQLALRTEQHFVDEERMMQDSGYPGLVSHRQEHLLMLAELKEFSRAICAGTECLKPTDLTALKGWLIGHLVSDDKPFACYLRMRQFPYRPKPLQQALTAQPAY